MRSSQIAALSSGVDNSGLELANKPTGSSPAVKPPQVPENGMTRKDKYTNEADKYKEYLDDLRRSGVTNMWGAGRYLEIEFELTPEKAKEVLLNWMNNFKKEDR